MSHILYLKCLTLWSFHLKHLLYDAVNLFLPVVFEF